MRALSFSESEINWIQLFRVQSTNIITKIIVDYNPSFKTHHEDLKIYQRGKKKLFPQGIPLLYLSNDKVKRKQGFIISGKMFYDWDCRNYT